MNETKKRLNPTSDAQRIGKPSYLSESCPRLSARPQDLFFDPSSTALIVVDMQNAYISKDGYMDRAGFDVSQSKEAVEGTKRAISIARRAGIQVVYLQNGWDSDYVEAGGAGSPNWHKSNALRTMRQHAEIDGTLLAKGGWDYALVEELQPGANDIVIAKIRYSGFFNSTLDSTLRARGIRTLLFTGIATNVCVESTLRDGYHLEYFCVLLRDATTHAGPDCTLQAAIYNIETFFGWTCSVSSFENALSNHTV